MSGTPPSSSFGRFVAELRRRHVVRAAVAYGAVGFVLLQMAEIALPAFLPGPRADAALRILVVAFLLVFPVVVAMAWVYEMTPQGLRAMSDLDVEAGRPAVARMLPRVAFLGFTVLVAGGTGLWWYRTDTAAVGDAGPFGPGGAPFVAASTTDASGPIRALAVLPLQDFSPDGDAQPYFAAGLHETLISQLSQLGTVRVISRTSVEGYAREGKSMPQVGAELGVDAVVEGSVLRDGDRVRVTAQLVHAASDTHLWARDYERDLQDVIALQREVAEAIAGEIGARVEEASGESETPTLVAEGGASQPTADVPTDVTGGTGLPSPPPVPAVQDAVFRGRFALAEPAGMDGEQEAARYFLEALAIDSTFVPALTGLAGAYLMRGMEVGDQAAVVELRRAKEVAAEAVRRDPTSIEAREVLASVDEALVELGARLTVVGSAPADGGVRVVHAGADSLMIIGDADTTRVTAPPFSMGSVTEIGRLVQAAMAASPATRGAPLEELRAMRRLEASGRQGAARERAMAALQRYPGEAALWDVAERLAVGQADWAGVIRLRRQRSEAGIPSPGPDVDALEASIGEDGATGYWTWKLDELAAREDVGLPVSPVDRAAALAALGDHDRALELLEEARRDQDPRLGSLRSDPVWDPLRPDRRFQALLRALARD